MGWGRDYDKDDDSTHLCSGLEYAGTVAGARSRPVTLSRPRQLVYSGHLYPWFMETGMSYGELREMMVTRQTFVMEPGQDYSVPLIVIYSIEELQNSCTRLATGWESSARAMTARSGA